MEIKSELPLLATSDVGCFNDLLGVLARYVVMPPEERLVTALWIVQAHCFEHFEYSGYLSITSPEKQCGKTTLLELLGLLVPRPWNCNLPSEAILYRHIDAAKPTLLLDEVDAIFGQKTADKYEGHRAILNAGFQQGATVPRCHQRTFKLIEFEVYCPKVLAGIGTLPDTVADRSFPIRMQRKSRDEHVERFRARHVRPFTEPVREAVAAWAAEHGCELGKAEPDLPDELSDRAQDVSEPLIAIADAVGVGREARVALVKLLTGDRADSTETAQIRLLRDIRTVFDSAATDKLKREALLEELAKLSESEWDNWYGKPLGGAALTKLLRPYGIKETAVRVDVATHRPDGSFGVEKKVVKGYRFADFVDAWNRYVPGVTDVTKTGSSETGTESSDPLVSLSLEPVTSVTSVTSSDGEGVELSA